METKLLYVTALMILYCIQSTDCCFIRNCPPGGKRSMDVPPLATHEVSFLIMFPIYDPFPIFFLFRFQQFPYRHSNHIFHTELAV